MNKQELASGKRFKFSNEEWCEQTQSDDIRDCEAWFDGESSGLPLWGHGFKIIFNCKLVISAKTFKSFERKLNQLVETWNLTPIEELEEA